MGQATSSRILIVDDSALVRELVRSVLQSEGFETLEAEDGARGLELVRTDSPDLVLCDMQMPGLSGIQVVQMLHVSAPLLPVIMFTDASELSIAVTAMRDGAYSYVSKSVEMDELVEEVRAGLQHRHLLLRNRELEEANETYRFGLEQLLEQKTREIRELQKRQYQAEKMASMGVFVAGIAHEVNNPLAVVKSSLGFLGEVLPELLENTPVDGMDAADREEVPRALSDARESTARIQRIVEALRRVAHPGAEGATCPVNAVVNEIQGTCRSLFPASVQLSFEVQEELGTVGLSRDDLQTVLTNLLVNAGHALETRSGEGRIACRVSRDAQGWIQAEVVDDGQGISKENLARIFDPFFTTKAPGKGTGLGLALVQQIVTEAGGAVSVESELQRGTRVMLRLPPHSPTKRPAPLPART